MEWSTVEQGSSTDKLKALQRYLGVEATGIPDDATHKALKAWQASLGLAATGNLDQATIAAIKTSLSITLSWWDWVVIWAFENKWLILGAGVVAVGGIGYWIWKRKKRRST